MYVLDQVGDNRQKQPKNLIRPSNTLGSFRVYYDNCLMQLHLSVIKPTEHSRSHVTLSW